jgi:hypothetical protein
MDFDEIKSKPYAVLIKDLPKIVSAFSTSSYLSKSNRHTWYRLRNRRVIKNVIIPTEIENYIVNEIKDLDKFVKSKINFFILIKNSWYISYRPFELAIFELIDKYILEFVDSENNNTQILMNNLVRKKDRPFDSFFGSDLIWLLGVYFNSLIKGSQLVAYRYKRMVKNYQYGAEFPLKNFSKKIQEGKEITFIDDIKNYSCKDCVFYLTWYFDIKQFLADIKEIKNQPTIVVWSLSRRGRIPRFLDDILSTKPPTMHYLYGFSEDTFKKVEQLLYKRNACEN